jgi:hypothetical protein
LEENERFSKKQKFIFALEHLPRFQVRLGRLEFRGIDSSGKSIFEQKRVDILVLPQSEVEFSFVVVSITPEGGPSDAIQFQRPESPAAAAA